MRYTVLGANGFIGRHLARALTTYGHDVLTPLRGDPRIPTTDLGVVFYCIGMTADFRNNVSATVEAHAGVLARLVEEAKFDHIIYCSSTRLYDDSFVDLATGETILNTDPRKPRQLYDISKALGENICLTSTRKRGSVARLSGVFDWDEGSPGFLSELLFRAGFEKSILLESAENYLRDYIHINDVVSSLIKMAEIQPCDIWNVASGENVSNKQIASLLNRNGWKIEFSRVAPHFSLPKCDITPLMEAGVFPEKTLDVINRWIGRADQK